MSEEHPYKRSARTTACRDMRWWIALSSGAGSGMMSAFRLKKDWKEMVLSLKPNEDRSNLSPRQGV